MRIVGVVAHRSRTSPARAIRGDAGGSVNSSSEGPIPPAYSPGVYVSNECSAWRRPITFQEAADDEGATGREAARIATFLRSHSDASGDLALHAAVYLVCLPATTVLCRADLRVYPNEWAGFFSGLTRVDATVRARALCRTTRKRGCS